MLRFNGVKNINLSILCNYDNDSNYKNRKIEINNTRIPRSHGWLSAFGFNSRINQHLAGIMPEGVKGGN